MLSFGIPMGDDIQSSISKLLAPFDHFLWLTLGLCLLAAISIILLLKQLGGARRHFVVGGRANRTPIFNMMIVLLGGGIANPRMVANIRYFGTFARTLTMVWFLGTLVLRGSYQGALFGFLQRQVIVSPYETIAQIFNSDCNLIIMSTAARSLDAYDLDKSRYILYSYSQQIAFQQMRDKEISGVVYSNNMQTGYFNLLNSKKRIKMTKDRLYLMPVVIYFPQYTILQPLFDSKLRLFSENGLIDYWCKKYSDLRTESKYQKREPMPLEIENIIGVLEICSALIAFSLIVIWLEVVSLKLTILKNSVEYFTY